MAFIHELDCAEVNRYRPSAAHLADTLKAAGFKDVRIEPDRLADAVVATMAHPKPTCHFDRLELRWERGSWTIRGLRLDRSPYGRGSHIGISHKATVSVAVDVLTRVFPEVGR